MKQYKHIRIMVLAAAMCCNITIAVSAQTKGSTTALSIGDRAPDVVLHDIVNYKDSTAHLTDFKGRLVILDFMSIGCMNCMKVLPKLDTLQQEFGDKIKFILVTVNDSETYVTDKRGWEFRRQGGQSYIPVWHFTMSLNNRKLKEYYPHKLISHIVWIDSNGITRAITGTKYITKENILAMLANSEVDWPVKKDVLK